MPKWRLNSVWLSLVVMTVARFNMQSWFIIGRSLVKCRWGAYKYNAPGVAVHTPGAVASADMMNVGLGRNFQGRTDGGTGKESHSLGRATVTQVESLHALWDDGLPMYGRGRVSHKLHLVWYEEVINCSTELASRAYYEFVYISYTFEKDYFDMNHQLKRQPCTDWQ